MNATETPIRPHLSLFAQDFTGEDGNTYIWTHPMGLRSGDVIVVPTHGTKHTVTGRPGRTRGHDLVEVPVADRDGESIFVPHAVHVLRVTNLV